MSAVVKPHIRVLIEEVGRALGCSDGEWTMEFRVKDGELVNTHLHHSPIKNAELESMVDELRRRAAAFGDDV